MSYQVGDRVKVVAPDPDVPGETQYVGSTGTIIEVAPDTGISVARYKVLLDDWQQHASVPHLWFCDAEIVKASPRLEQ